MVSNVVVSRMKPQLVRKRTIMRSTSTIKIVIQPSKSKVASLQQVKQIKIRSDKSAKSTKSTKIQAKPPKPPANAAVSRKKAANRTLRKRTQVTHITKNVSAESIARINSLRQTGSGKLLIIIGNGPSVEEAEFNKFRGISNIHTMSVNKPDIRLWPTTHWCFFDGSQIRRHEDFWTTYEGNIFNSTAIKKSKSNSLQIKNLSGKGFSRDLAKGLYIGRSSVFAAMQIAMWLAYEHVYIFGCDMNPEGLNGKLHFYGVNPDVEPEIRKSRFESEANHYDHAATILTPEERKKFTFCSLGINPWPFIHEFNTLDHKTAADKIVEHASKL